LSSFVTHLLNNGKNIIIVVAAASWIFATWMGDCRVGPKRYVAPNHLDQLSLPSLRGR